MQRTYVIAEIGINHNGDIELAKKLIDAAKFAGANAVKFQKRNIDKVYSKEQLDKPRESPWGTTTREQKLGLEFGRPEYDIINAYCKEREIEWFASAWDLDSVNFLKHYKTPHNKIASAMLTYVELLRAVSMQGTHTFISTGMSTMAEINAAVNIFENNRCQYTLLHCNSQYPMPDKLANLQVINKLKQQFGSKAHCRGIGYSGHEVGLITSIAAVVLGATVIERHITMERSMYGSDQSSSVEPIGIYRLVEYIRTVEDSIGDGNKVVTEAEQEGKAKLRRSKDY